MPGPRTPSPLGAATRLLVLGTVQIFQPVHGYFVRRELISWQIDEWAKVHPGSIYNALRSLSRLGVLDEQAVEHPGRRPERTLYRVTAAGEQELDALLRSGLRSIGDDSVFRVALGFAGFLPRGDVLEAVREHLEALERKTGEVESTIAMILGNPSKPDASAEVTRLGLAVIGSEIAWARAYLEKVADGAYSFAGEPPDWTMSEAHLAEAKAAGAYAELPSLDGRQQA